MSELTKQDLRDFSRIVFICICWYIVSSVNGVLGKTILSEFPYPMTVTMVQLTSITVYSVPLLSILGVRRLETSGWSYYIRALAPLAFFKFASSVLAHISIWKVPVSYAHTVKASMPIFTVIISRVLLGEKHSWTVYCSLLPVVLGVAIATITEISFELMGLVSALMATVGFSLMNIYSKRALKETGVHHLRLLHILGLMATCMFAPVWAVIDLPQIHPEMNSHLLMLLLVDGGFHWMQNILAFTLLKLVTPLTYAVANVTKRISVITASLLLLKNPVTITNVGGMFVAIIGVFLYNRAKYSENQKAVTLPTTIKQKPATHPPIWQNHMTFEPKMQIVSNGVTPMQYVSNGDLKRNQ